MLGWTEGAFWMEGKKLKPAQACQLTPLLS